MSWQSEGVRSIELPAAQACAPLSVSAERGVACAFVGVQRAVVLDLVGLPVSEGTPALLHEDAQGDCDVVAVVTWPEGKWGRGARASKDTAARCTSGEPCQRELF